MQVSNDDSRCKLELEPSGLELSPLTRSGHLPVPCLNISVRVLAVKPSVYISSIYSWELDIKYSHGDLPMFWINLPLPKGIVYARHNSSLQIVIDAAMEGSIIVVDPGSYRENLFINKTVKLVSSGGCAETHIFGEISISAAGVTLQGMTFYPSTELFSALTINSSLVTILNCRFVDDIESLALYSPLPTVAINCINCLDLRIVNNDFYSWKHAVMLKNASNPTIQSNTFRSCQHAIFTDKTGNVKGNLFENNMIGIDTPLAQTKEILNNNIFSGNVIPLFCGQKYFFPPQKTPYRPGYTISNILYVTGVCGTGIPLLDKCASIGPPKGEE